MSGPATGHRASPDDAPWAARLESAAFCLLLACLVARCILPETTFRMSTLRLPVAVGLSGPAPPANRGQLAGVTLSVLTLTACALWLLARAVAKRLVVRHSWLAAGIGVFAVLSLCSALAAADQRTALHVWLTHVSLLSGGYLAAQLCADRRRLRILLVVLTALAAVLAAKGLEHILETPHRIRDFENNREAHLAASGWEPDSPNAHAMDMRVRNWAPVGYVALANIFASMLIVAAAAVVTVVVAKFRAAHGDWATWRKVRKRGEVHLPTLAAVLTAPIALAVAIILILTCSRGALLASAVVGITGTVIFLFRHRLVAHWRKVAGGAGGLLILGIVAVAAWGLTYDRLPTRTMTFRWFYWSATGQIIRDHPVWGVGPGNFPAAYLRYRRPAGEEAVKTPHNVVLHALTQCGVPGGIVYLILIGAVLVGVCRPARGQVVPADTTTRPAALTACIVAAAAVFAARAVLADMASDPRLLAFDALPGTGLFVLALVIVAWTGQRFSLPDENGPGRVILACALVAFVLHNMVTFSFWVPAAAALFWTVGGAMLGTAGGGRIRNIRVMRWPISLGAIAAVVAAAIVLWWPVLGRTRLTEAASAAMARGEWNQAKKWIYRAARTDTLDSLASADTARVILAEPTRGSRQRQWENHIIALARARQAMARNGSSAGHARLAARVAWTLTTMDRPYSPERMQEARGYFDRAVALDPCDSRLRLTFARFLLDAGDRRACLDQLRAAENIDRQLLPGSAYRFSPTEQADMQRMKVRCGDS